MALTLVSYTETTDWVSGGTTKATASVSWQTGDVVVVIGLNEGGSTLGTPTNTGSGLTFTAQQSHAGDAATCGSMCAAGVATSASSGTVSMTNSVTAKHFGFGVWVWRGSPGIGTSVEQHTGGSAGTESVSLALTGGADGAVVWGLGDFSASALGTIVATPTNTRQRAVDAGFYTRYVADLVDQASTSGVLYGVSGAGSTTGPFSIVALEIKAVVNSQVPYQPQYVFAPVMAQ